MPLRIVNDAGSKVSLALWRDKGPTIILQGLDDLEVLDLKDALNATTSPKLTHVQRDEPGSDGKERLTLFFDEKLDAGVPFDDWKKGRSVSAPTQAPAAPVAAKAPAPATTSPGPDESGIPEDLPLPPTTIVPGRTPIGKGPDGP